MIASSSLRSWAASPAERFGVGGNTTVDLGRTSVTPIGLPTNVRDATGRGSPPIGGVAGYWSAVFTLLLACQEPFGTDRHVLEGDRIAAVAVSRLGDDVTLTPALLVDGHLWSDDAVTVEQVASDGRVDLTVTFPSGAERQAFAEVPAADGAFAITTVDQGVVDGLAFDTVLPAEVTRDARLALPATPASSVPAGSFARLTVTTDATEPPFLRWMGAGGGQFFELDATRADWATGVLVFDDEEVVSRTPRGAGVEGMIALALGADGTTAWRAFDVCVGDPVGLDVNGRRLPIDATPAPGLWQGRLQADDTVPSGLSLTGAVPVSEADLPEVDPYGTEALGCTSHEGPFDPSWLADASCLRPDVLGATVVVEAK